MDDNTFTALVVIGSVAVLAPVIARIARGRIPTVVLEIALGIVVGHEVLGLAHVTPFVSGFSSIGLTLLFFMAGYEIDVEHIKGRPLRQATLAWVVGFAFALLVAVGLEVAGVTLSTLLIALALTTTALGTLVPILEDNGELVSRFGIAVMAVGGVGEFFPIIVITLLLSNDDPIGTALLLVGFVVLAFGAAFLAMRPYPERVASLFARTLDGSSQLPVRVVILLVVLLGWIATHLGLDILLGGFAAGMVVRLGNKGDIARPVEIKLAAISYGLFVPVFFVVTGMTFDIRALGDAGTLFRVPLFLLLFLVLRGIPTWWSTRHDLDRSERIPAALLASTALPVIVVITQLGLNRHEMKPETAAALITAGMLSVLIFPAIAFGLRRRTSKEKTRPAFDATTYDADVTTDARTDEG
jgi:Kef-type K+ transport system membrane component KefB